MHIVRDPYRRLRFQVSSRRAPQRRHQRCLHTVVGWYSGVCCDRYHLQSAFCAEHRLKTSWIWHQVQSTFDSWPKNASTSKIRQNWQPSLPFSLLKLERLNPLKLPPARRIIPSLFSPKESPKSSSGLTPEYLFLIGSNVISCCCFFFFVCFLPGRLLSTEGEMVDSFIVSLCPLELETGMSLLISCSVSEA